jgi:putative transposase
MAKRVYRGTRTPLPAFKRHPPHALFNRRHDGKVAVERSNARCCWDGFEFRYDDGAALRVVFELDCCDQEFMSWAATSGGYTMGHGTAYDASGC